MLLCESIRGKSAKDVTLARGDRTTREGLTRRHSNNIGPRLIMGGGGVGGGEKKGLSRGAFPGRRGGGGCVL